MPGDNWLDETIPSRRHDPPESGIKGENSSWSQIPPRVWAFAFVAAVLLFALFGFWGLYLFRGRLGASAPTPTAIIWSATPSPTLAATATPNPTETPEAEEPVEDAATPTASLDITIGGYVRVSGTAGYGLSLREGPGANYARMDVAGEDELFIIVQGPQTSAGSPWWRIRDPENEDRTWWAIGNYLQPVEHP